MTRKHNLAALIAAGVVTALAVAGFSAAAGSSAPSNTSPPTISGTPQDGQTLTAHDGTWNGTTPITYSYQWRRCDSTGGSCSDISGATDKTYTLKAVDVGNTLRVRVTAKNADGSSSATAVPTAVIQAAAPKPPVVVNGCPAGTGTVNASQLAPPARLSIDQQSASPSPITSSTTDLTVKFHVSACNGRSVQGALVYATAVPYEQFSIPPETPTDATGWVTLTMHRDVGFPADRHQELLAMFVRARGAGNDILGGISTRRLVSFPVTL